LNDAQERAALGVQSWALLKKKIVRKLIRVNAAIQTSNTIRDCVCKANIGCVSELRANHKLGDARTTRHAGVAANFAALSGELVYGAK